MSISLQIHHGNPYEFSIKEKLNSKIWIGKELRPSIRDRLLIIAEKFIDFLDIVSPEAVVDIQFTGSLANYNYTDYSDIDLHVLIDLDKVGENRDFIKLILKGKGGAWNNARNITIKNYEVELYAQDSEEAHASTGVYSILKDKWIIFPSRQEVDIDKKQILKKIILFQDRIFDAIKGEAFERLEKLKALKKKIFDMRRAGLKEGGEYSYENLTFKAMRRLGFIKKINKEINKAIDQQLSINNQ
jgi:hypothetical protein